MEGIVVDQPFSNSGVTNGRVDVPTTRPSGIPSGVGTVDAMDEKLRAVFDELQTAIRRSEADGEIDETERAELRAIVERLDTVLAVDQAPGAGDAASTDDGGDDDGIIEHLEESAIRFEGRHPTVAAVIRSAVDTLTGYGM